MHVCICVHMLKCTGLLSVVFEHMLHIKFISPFCEITLRSMPLNAFDDKSSLVQEMVWCL